MSSVISLFSYKQGRLGKIGARDMRYSHNSYWGLTFTAGEANSTISMAKSDTPPAVSLETSINDGKTWTPFIVGATTITLANIGDRVLFRAGDGGTGGDGINNAFASSSSVYNYFIMTGKIAASGDISSILNRNQPISTLNNWAFTRLFRNCTSLTTAPALPATTLAEHCYEYMFWGCTSLTITPDLPATTLANYCYRYMFYGCTNLTTALDLPATTLANYCYSYMFYGCTSLMTTPDLPATTLADYCYFGMFSDCTSLASAPALPATTLAGSCYHGMFSGCTSLASAPVLPATTLAGSCYSFMFFGCTSLTTAPELPATTLVSSCYISMFDSCSNLSNISVGFTTWDTSKTTNWVSGVAQSGTFECPTELSHTSSDFGKNKIPTGWSVQPYIGLTNGYVQN